MSSDHKPETRAATAAHDRVKALELPLPSQPFAQDAPDWPANLSDLTDDDLSEQLSYWSALVAFAGFEVARSDVERKTFEAQKEACWTRQYLKADAEAVTDRRNIASASEDVLKAQERFLVHDATYRLLQALFAGYEQKYAAVSRELTRRLGSQARGGDDRT